MTIQTATTSQETSAQKTELINLIWDMYKECYNIRPRWVIREQANLSIRDLEATLNELEQEMRDQMADEVHQADEDAAVVAFICAEQGITVETYNRWMKEAA